MLRRPHAARRYKIAGRADEALFLMGESFGSLLKRHRVAAGLSQETLAERAGVSVDAISALERGLRHAPHKATLDLLAPALGITGDARTQFEEAASAARMHRSEDLHELVLNNLPPELTSFVDREKEVPEIKELLQSHRLVTLVGTGGAGKTRCALRIGAEVLDRFRGGVWLADLAPISDPALVSTVIAGTQNVHEVPNRAMLDTLLADLSRKRLLLIMDNCEHVIDETRRVASAILLHCPDVQILATSRETFGIAGERAYRMPSLLTYNAVELFTDRALSADNRFMVTVESEADIADICRRLDGIPLAIELAAARVSVLSPRELARKLDERFHVLTAGNHTALPRHQTMRALIDWSYDLLSDDERRLFRKLSIFAGGFTLDTAVAVCSDSSLSEIAVFDRISSLVNKSLVQTVVAEGDTRYRLLESTRQYAREKLNAAGEEHLVAHAHAQAFAELAEQLSDAWETMPDRTWYAKMEPELENFRAALSWSFGEHGDAVLGQRLASVLRREWVAIGPVEGRRWLEIAQQSVSEDTPNAVRAALDLAESGIASLLKQYKTCLSLAERALARYRDLGDARGIAMAEGLTGIAHILLGNILVGEDRTKKFLSKAEQLGARKSAMRALEYLASARELAGDLPAARRYFAEALSAARMVGAERSIATIALGLAETEFRSGDAVAALRLVDEALLILRLLRDTRNIALAKYNMAAYLVALRRFGEARTAAREALTAANDTQFSVGLAWILQHFAAIAALRPGEGALVMKDRRRAAGILGYVDTRVVALEALRQYTEQQEYDAISAELLDALGADQLEQIMIEGMGWSEDRAIAEALLV